MKMVITQAYDGENARALNPQTGPAGDMPAEEETVFTDYKEVDGNGGQQPGDLRWRGGRHHADLYERDVKLRPEDS
jgi:hypothetical protein